jgi:chorismate mutase
MELLISKLRSVDEEIILLLAERITISRSIGELKREQKIEIEQPSQWKSASEHRMITAKEYHV